MRLRTLSPILTDQRGIALPMALMIILILSALMAAFLVLGASEPTLAANQQRVAQARAMAESGLERAIWALHNPDDANGIPSLLVTPAAPYDGDTTIPVMFNGAQVGVFTVRVTSGEINCLAVNERCIVATGWAPTKTGSGPRAMQRIQVTVTKMRFLDPPVALAVRGELDIGGNSYIDSRQDTSCGTKGGTWSRDDTERHGSAEVFGAGNDTPNTKALYSVDPSSDIVTMVPNGVFDTFTYSNDELTMLKSIARAQGTYYQGSVTFNASNPIPNGLIFVDTVSGQNITPATNFSDFASLTISGNPAEHVDPITGVRFFQGWIVVNGSARINGSFEMHGLLYIQNDLTYQGVGTGKVVGAVISQNIRDTVRTSIDSDTYGNSTIIYNCGYAKTGDNQISQSFTIKLGTYKAAAG